uniref:Peptidase S1 domain-containing protein n=1 Tax=Heliothis virescens TaxID=7102 RepID=A0A2A4K0S1_HELVI
MLSVPVVCVLLNILSCLNVVSSSASCGIDNSPTSHVYDGVTRIETYPWLGILYYPYGFKRYTTAVVLVTKQIALAAATEIDELPKDDFRARARVVIGQNCSGESIGIRDYSLHPDYRRDTHSTLAIVQLETDHVTITLRPICPPPSLFESEKFYAMILSENCTQSTVRIHKMKYVSLEECKIFYRRADLDLDSMWPMHTACAKSVTGGHCVWRSGAILVIKINRRWRLLGFGIYGPGCEAPSRFLDYSKYHHWVQRSVETIGRPAITKVAPNYLILRRTSSNVRRFGECDREEMKAELFTDEINMDGPGNMIYNLTVVTAFEYSCVIFKASSLTGFQNGPTPVLNLRKWCGAPFQVCAGGWQYLEINFFVEVKYLRGVELRIAMYGKQAKTLDPPKAMVFLNSRLNYPYIPKNPLRERYDDDLSDEFVSSGEKDMKVKGSSKAKHIRTSPKYQFLDAHKIALVADPE